MIIGNRSSLVQFPNVQLILKSITVFIYIHSFTNIHIKERKTLNSNKTNFISYAPTEDRVIYPESEGKPLVESERHLRCIFRMLDILETHFADTEDAYVWSNMMLYYVKDNPCIYLKPDIFVSFGVGKHERLFYKVWEEGKPPDFIMEFASKSTYDNDLSPKKDIYADIGVTENFLLDPFRTCLPTPLMGFRLVDDDYVEIPPLAEGRVKSETLTLEFFLQDDDVGVSEPVTGKLLKTRAEMEADARREVENKLKELQEKLKRLEAESTNL